MIKGSGIASRQREAWIETEELLAYNKKLLSIASRQREAWIETSTNMARVNKK